VDSIVAAATSCRMRKTAFPFYSREYSCQTRYISKSVNNNLTRSITGKRQHFSFVPFVVDWEIGKKS